MTSYNRGESDYKVSHDLSYDDEGHHHHHDIYESESWMIAYLDLMTLLLALFSFQTNCSIGATPQFHFSDGSLVACLESSTNGSPNGIDLFSPVVEKKGGNFQ